VFFINHRYDGVQLWDLRLVLSCPSPALWPDADGALVQSDCTAAVAADVLLSQAPGIHQVCWILSFISFWFLYPSTFNLLEASSDPLPTLLHRKSPGPRTA
jgi:zeta-carotene isomerase